ncbi:hypothetical protein ABH945_007278 [Paraburkholderia sp. GAS333]
MPADASGEERFKRKRLTVDVCYPTDTSSVLTEQYVLNENERSRFFK